MRTAILLASLLGPVASAAEPGSLTLDLGALRVSVDRATGSLVQIADPKAGVIIHESPAADEIQLTVDGAETPIGAALAYRDHRVIETGASFVLEIDRASPEWIFTERYLISRSSPRLERAIRVRYLGDAPVTTASFRFKYRIPAADDSDVDLPGGFQPMDLQAGFFERRTTPIHVGDPTRFAAVWTPADTAAAVYGVYSREERPLFTTMTADGPDHLAFEYTVPFIMALERGDAAEWGGDVSYTYTGEPALVFAAAQQQYSSLGLRGPVDTPEWARMAHVYEVQIGDGRFDAGAYTYGRYPNTEALIQDLPRIRALGFEAIHLMPAFPFPGYTIVDLRDPKVQYDVDLAALTQAIHRLGMRIVLDVLVHGVIDQEITNRIIATYKARESSEGIVTDIPGYVYNNYADQLDRMPARHPLRDQHPEWFMRNRDGSMAHTYTWAFQLQNPGVQDYIISALEHYMEAYGVDGFRIDAPFWNQIPDWSETFPHRPSMYLDSGPSLIRAMLPRLRDKNPEVFVYSEGYAPEWAPGLDASYNYDAFWITEELLEPFRTRGRPFHSPIEGAFWAPRNGPRPPINAAQARDWLLERARTRPVGVRTIHQTDSHDSFWWAPTGERFKREVFGAPAFGAMFFMLATLGEPTLTYMGAEDGSEAQIARALRSAKHPTVRSGSLRLDAPDVSSQDVFAVLWTRDRDLAVPLTNFSSAEVTVEVTFPEGLPEGLDGPFRFRDVHQGRRVTATGERAFRVTLPPLGTAMVTARSRR